MWSQIILVLIVLFSFLVADHSTNPEVDRFQTFTIWKRTDGDKLLYTQTKITIPSQEFKYHQLRFNWIDPTQMVTQIIFECNRNCTCILFAEEGDSEMTIFGMSWASKQLISTVFVYGMAVDPEGGVNPED